MFAMSFEDEEGNRLSIPGEITFSYPIAQLSNETDISEIRVWTMNPNTGWLKLWVNFIYLSLFKSYHEWMNINCEHLHVRARMFKVFGSLLATWNCKTKPKPRADEGVRSIKLVGADNPLKSLFVESILMFPGSTLTRLRVKPASQKYVCSAVLSRQNLNKYTMAKWRWSTLTQTATNRCQQT